MKAISAIFITLLLTGCDPTYWLSGQVGKAIREEVHDRQGSEINLAGITSFDWDEFYLFGPYTPRDVICKTLGILNKECPTQITDESSDDGEMYLVFQNRGKIVHQEMHIRSNGDFTPLDFAQPLTPENAIFSISRAGNAARGKPLFHLKLQPREERDSF